MNLKTGPEMLRVDLNQDSLKTCYLAISHAILQLCSPRYSRKTEQGKIVFFCRRDGLFISFIPLR